MHDSQDNPNQQYNPQPQGENTELPAVTPTAVATPTSHAQLLDNSHIRTSALTKQLIGLHTKLWPRWLKRNKGQILFALLYLMYGIFPAAGFGFYLYYQAIDHNNFMPFTMLMGVGVLAYWLISVTMPSAEAQLDIKYFSVLPISGRQLLPGLVITSLLTMRGLMVVINTVISIGFGIAALLQAPSVAVPVPLAIVIWIIATLSSGALAVLGAEILATLFGIAAGRRSKERLTMLASFGFLLMIIALNLALNTGQDFTEQGSTLETIGHLFIWLPWGWAGGMMTTLATGNYLGAIVTAVLSTALVIGMWRWWARLVQRAMFVAGTESSGSGKADSPTKWSYQSPGRAIIYRWFLYVRRDLRLSYAALSLPLMSVLFIVLSAIGTNPSFRYIGAFMVAVSATSLGSNLFGLDGPANWLHLIAPLRGRQFLKPRLLGIALLTLPSQILFLILWIIFFEVDLSFAFIVVVIISGAFFSWGFGAVLSVYNAYPTSPPGTNPMKDRSGYSSGAFVTSFGSLIGIWLPMIPGIALMLWGWKFSGPTWAFPVGATVSIVISVIASMIMYRMACRRLENTWPDIYSKVRTYA